MFLVLILVDKTTLRGDKVRYDLEQDPQVIIAYYLGGGGQSNVALNSDQL